jgi:hypothetical protein
MILGLFESKNLALPTYKFIDRKTGLNRFKPVFHRSSQIPNWDGPKTGPRLRSLPVLKIFGPNRSRSGPVPVFRRSQDWTSKHYICKRKTR